MSNEKLQSKGKGMEAVGSVPPNIHTECAM